MAIPKVCGIETEYGIVVRGADTNPIAASSVLINAYLVELGHSQGRPDMRVSWDFDDESPASDARGALFSYDAYPPEIETHLVNAVLTNGARYYVDHAHPEYSSPECLDAREALLYDKAGEQILLASMRAAGRQLQAGQEIVVYKNNSDGKGNSYGCHENYLVARSVPFGRIVHQITPHFVTRQIFTGSGKVGVEAGRMPASEVPFQITQRADFFEEEVGLETTLKRPIVNTRDEPHCDPKRFRRLHVITGDANMCDVATFLKVGTTAVVLAMIEDDAFPPGLTLRRPVKAMRHVSYDLGLAQPIELDNGGSATALEIQWQIFEAARHYEKRHGLGAVGAEVGAQILNRWEGVLDQLGGDVMRLAGQLDWVTKYRLMSAYRERHAATWADPRIAALDLQYHDLRPERSLIARLAPEALVSPAEVEHAISHPPTGTRAYFRGRCIDKYRDSIVAANWDSMMFDLGTDPLRRVPMMDPMRGTLAHVGSLMDECDTAAELLTRLGREPA